jgi:hypothetical protein
MLRFSEWLAEEPLLGRHMSKAARARDIEQSDREYIAQRQARLKAKKEKGLNELSVAVLSRYIRRSDDYTEEPKRTQVSNDWDKVHRRANGSTLAKLKMRKYAVKVPAGKPTGPIKIDK